MFAIKEIKSIMQGKRGKLLAFVNVKLTPEEREEFGRRGIVDPHMSTTTSIKPYFITVDWKKDCFLVQVGEHRDYPKGKKFLFIWKEKIYWLQFDWTINEDIWSWYIPSEKNYFISTRFPYDSDSQFLETLKEALYTFGINGENNSNNLVKVEF